eukprot:GHUV01017683.1.p1 GENE.GHUV01017683.1~~GHUV01017683.1.p1  ORF type:complete len:374 (+),score=63.61 GHUV01017683.1:651-1772(+)
MLQLDQGTVLTLEQLQELGPLLRAAESSTNNAVKRLLGMLSLVNMMWLTGILGICITIGPTVHVCCRPVFNVIYQLVARLGSHVLHIWRALAQRMQPLMPIILFTLCFYATASALAYSGDSQVFVAVTGQGLAVVLVCWQAIKHEARQRERHPAYVREFDGHQAPRWYHFLLLPSFRVNMFAALTLASTAVLYQSRLAGFLAAAAFFGALGFVVVPFSCGWAVGWHSRSTMWCSEIASAVLLLSMITCRLLGLGHNLTSPFELGVSVMGANCMFLAALCQSSRYYAEGKAYSLANLCFVLVAVGCVAVSAMLGLMSLRNTAVTYLALWASQKAVELALEKAAWVAMFAASLALWRGSLFLSTHPEWLASLAKL